MIRLDITHLDWLTLTTWEPNVIATMSDMFPHDRGKPEKRLQYDGLRWDSGDGSAFFGTGEQRGKPHFMAQISGFAADRAFDVYRGLIKLNLVNVTRLDIAATVERPEDWSQAWLWAALRSATDTTSYSYLESGSGPNGGKLATVYVGSRLSRRFMRIYEKPLDDGIALRAEVEYKGDRARAVARMLADGGSAAAIMNTEIHRLAEPELWRTFEPCLDDRYQRPVVVREQGNTERWLVHTALPALVRWMNEHDDRERVEQIRRAFLAALTKHD